MDLARKLNTSNEIPGISKSAKKSRTRTGCALCRARKIKCDEHDIACLNCERLHLNCPGYGPEAASRLRSSEIPANEDPSLITQAGIKRRRTHRSCTACRSSKTRCSGTSPVCERCTRKRIECIYANTSKPTLAQASLTPLSPQRQNDSSIAWQSHGAGTPNNAFERSSPTSRSATTHQTRPGSTSRSPDGMPSISSIPQDSLGVDSLSWLVSLDLPSKSNIRRLADEYFANVHPLRCFGFIHKPSFMQRLDEGLAAEYKGNALLYIICALGAKFYALHYSNTIRTLPPKFVLSTGNEWAKRARNLILDDLNEISVENLMASVLLYDHEIRIGNYASAFMLSGISSRMSQALQLNVEHSADVLCTELSPSSPSISSKEARRRLMWACYIMDSWVGSGVDQLTLLNEADIKIQLPCHSRNFLLQIPCITETLEKGKLLGFLPAEIVPQNPAENMGMMAYFIRLIELRKKVLRYVKHLDTAKPPWLPESELTLLAQGFESWKQSLPSSMHFTVNAIYTRKESCQLGALSLLWCTYHQTLCDLYRIGLPTLFKIRKPFNFPPEQQKFLQYCQETCFQQAQNVALIIAEALRHGTNMLADTWMETIAFDSTRIILYYLTQVVDQGTERGKALMKETIPLFEKTIHALKLMMPMFATAEHLHNTAKAMLKKSGVDIRLPDEMRRGERHTSPSCAEDTSIPGSPIQETPEYVLNPLAIYRMARRTVTEKHAPESSATPSLPSASGMSPPVAGNSELISQWQQHQRETGEFSTNLSGLLHQQQPSSSSSSSFESSATTTYLHQKEIPPPPFPQHQPSQQLQIPPTPLESDGQQDSIFEFYGGWQPAETALEGMEWGLVPPWAAGAGAAVPGAGDVGAEGQFDLQSPALFHFRP